jgi:hypothetical protein
MKRSEFLTSLGVAVASPLPVPSPFPTGNESLAVYHVRDDVKAPVAISPDALLSFKGVIVRTVTDASTISAASAAVDASLARARDGAVTTLDCRWGLRFATPTDRFVHSVYCDATGTNGQVDGRAVTFANGRALVAYLIGHFGPA